MKNPKFSLLIGSRIFVLGRASLVDVFLLQRLFAHAILYRLHFAASSLRKGASDLRSAAHRTYAIRRTPLRSLLLIADMRREETCHISLVLSSARHTQIHQRLHST